MALHIRPVQDDEHVGDLDRRLRAVEYALLAQRRHHAARRFETLDRAIWAAAGAVVGGWAVAAVALLPEVLR